MMEDATGGSAAIGSRAETPRPVVRLLPVGFYARQEKYRFSNDKAIANLIFMF
jgi:hypothetical protein